MAAAAAGAVAAGRPNTEPNPAVQQFVQLVCPNIQSNLSVLSQVKAGANQCQPLNPSSFPASGNNSNNGGQLYQDGATQCELSASSQ